MVVFISSYDLLNTDCSCCSDSGSLLCEIRKHVSPCVFGILP